MPQFGWKAAPEQFGPNELVEWAVVAERAGFDSIEASDHFNPWSDSGQASFVWTLLGAMAAQTQRIALGPGVTCPILRYNPAIIAQAVATLAVLAPGRTFLGVGTGEALNEYPTTGEWPPYRERQERLGEAIHLIRELLKGEQVGFAGKYYRTRKAKLYTCPKEQVPIYISSLVPNSAFFAGRHGDGLFTTGGQEPRVYRELIANFESGARAAGKDPTGMPRIVEIRVELTDDEQGAIETIKRYWASSFLPAMFTYRIYDPATAQRNGAVVGTEAIRREVLISADPEEHVQHARQFLDLGFTQIYFMSAAMNQRAFLEAYGRDVLPKLRQQTGGQQRQRGA